MAHRPWTLVPFHARKAITPRYVELSPIICKQPELFGRPNPLTVEPFASMPAHVKLQAVKQLLAKVNSTTESMLAKAKTGTSRSRHRYDFTMHPLDPGRPHQSFEVVPPNRAQPSVRWSGTGEAGDDGAFSFFPFTFSPVDLAAVDVERDEREIERQETRAKAQGQAKAKGQGPSGGRDRPSPSRWCIDTSSSGGASWPPPAPTTTRATHLGARPPSSTSARAATTSS